MKESKLPEALRLSQQSKEHLIRVKRQTGVKNWNVLCRWGLLLSLADERAPSENLAPADSNVEMSWRTFAGNDAAVIEALLRARCAEDGSGFETCLKVHLQRGISRLLEQDLADLARLALAQQAMSSQPGLPVLA